jgi:ParB-like chromosome segregation protein Spo0J
MAKTKAAAEKIWVEYVPLSEVVKWPRNPKRHDLEALGGSMGRFGYTQPLLKDEKSGKLVAGHGRLESLEASKAAGNPPPRRVLVKGKEWLVPVVRGVSFANQSEAEAYLLADNRITEIGGWDEPGVAAILTGLIARADDDRDAALAGLGFTAAEADRILEKIPKPPKDVRFKAGTGAVTKMVECPKCSHKFQL